MSEYYPLFLKVKGKECVVIGGGNVAERKVRGLLAAGAQVKVVAPELTQGLRRLAERGRIQATVRRYRNGDLDKALLAFAATDDTRLNSKIARDATRTGIPINVVDSPEASSFIVGAMLRRGDIVIAVSTGGHSPALAKKIRIALEASLPREYSLLPPLLASVRKELKRVGETVKGEAWQKSLNIPVLLRLLRKGDRDSAKRSIFKTLAGCTPRYQHKATRDNR